MNFFNKIDEIVSKTVLIVENSESCFLLEFEYLRMLGLNVIRATNAEDLLEILELLKVDIIIYDLKTLYKNGGTQTLETIKLKTADIPVIIQTSVNPVYFNDEPLFSKCNEVLIKPIDLQKLSKIIEKYALRNCA